ncbi:MAG: class I SAM-dependent methyltransferase [Actinomycetota bacterium]
MLTVDFERLGVRDGVRLLDMGCGGGRHAYEAWRRGATVVALDLDEQELKGVGYVVGQMLDDGELPHGAVGGPTRASALALPFPDATFDAVITSEVLEHIWDDRGAIRELVRVLRPGGRMAVTVPTRWPERVSWAIDHRYHDRPGGHVRIYRQHELELRLEEAGLLMRGSHHAHALHSPYWWLKCAVGVDDDAAPLVRRYHDLLAHQIVHQPAWLNRLERALNPVLGKSLVVYTEKA